MTSLSPEQKLLQIVNMADSKFLDVFADGKGKGLGEKMAEKLVETRTNLPNGVFTSLKEVRSIKGIGDDKIEDMLAAANELILSETVEDDMIESRTAYVISGKPPTLEEFRDQIRLERRGIFIVGEGGETLESSKDQTFILHYDRSVDRDKLFKTLLNHPSVKQTIFNHTYFIEDANGEFIIATPNQSAGVFNIQAASVCRVAAYKPNAYGPAPQGAQTPNTSLAIALVCESGYNAGQERILKMSGNTTSQFSRITSEGFKNSSETGPQAPSNWLTQDEYYFDVSGFFSPPTWASPDLYRSFTMMESRPQSIDPFQQDNRRFIETDGGLSSGLKVSNLPVPQQGYQQFRRENQFRVAEVIRNVCIRPVHNGSFVGQEEYNVFLNWALPSGQPGFCEGRFLAPGSSLPNTIFLDMIVLYGRWEDREKIACKVMFALPRSVSVNNRRRFLIVNDDDSLSVSGFGTSLTRAQRSAATFDVEPGWGGNKVFLKTVHGKYLSTWRRSQGGYNIGSSNTVPLNGEQWEILLP